MKISPIAVAALATLFVCGQAGARSHASVDVALRPTGATRVPLGAPFSFTARVAATSAPVTGNVVFAIAPAGGRSVRFVGKSVVVPPGADTEIEASVVPAQWFRGPGRYRVAASIGGAQVGKPLDFVVTKPRTAVPVFADVTGEAGLARAVLPAATCGRWASGAAWADVNGDGNLDFFLTRIGKPAQLWLSDGKGHFREAAAARGLAHVGLALGASFADYDNDGDEDLIVVGDGPPKLFRNDGTGHFVDVAPAAGIGGDYMGMSASWGDFDNDGNLDLYVANHTRCAPTKDDRFAVTYDPDRLYHNNGDGTFTDVTSWLEHDPAISSDGSTRGAGFVASWFDYNGDGRQDIYLANDFLGKNPDHNHLWRNDGPGPDGAWRFTDVSIDSGTSFSMNSMGLGIGDYNRDLRLDIAISNWGGNRLLRNDPDGTFTDVAEAAGVQHPLEVVGRRSLTWGPEFRDFNDDGWEDLYVAAGYLAGYLSSDTTPQRNQLFVNDGHGGFYDLSTPSGADDAGQTRGAPTADYDRDGRMDILSVDQEGSVHLLRNVTPGRAHWLELRTVGTNSNRDGCGTRIVLTAPTGKQLREILCGSTSTNSGSDKVAHFGLGSATRVTRLDLVWPSGIRQTLTRNLPKVDTVFTLVEPKASPAELKQARIALGEALAVESRGGRGWLEPVLVGIFAALAAAGFLLAYLRRRRAPERTPRKRVLTIRGRPYPVLLPTLRDPRLHLAAVIVSLQILGQVAFDFRLSIAQILIAVGTCGVLEVAIAFWRQKVIMWPASALLTGNGVAFILRVPATKHGDWWSTRGWWIFAGTAAISLLSKYVIQLGGGHVFNPSNFGLVLCFLVLGSKRADPLDFWWAPMGPWMGIALALIVLGGLAILVRLKLIWIAIAFWLSLAAGIGVLAASGHAMTARWHLGPITGTYFWWVLVSSPEILIFLFFMITDPKTIPKGPRARVAYAVAIGLLASLLSAPMRTEFATKVAVLGALTIVCAARVLLPRLVSVHGWGSRASQRARDALRGPARLGAGLAGAVAVAGLLVLAGIPSRPSAGAENGPAGTPADLAVTVVHSKRVASQIDRRMAERIARDVVADLRAESAARHGAVPVYRVDTVRLALEVSETQGPPVIVCTVHGTMRFVTYDRSAAMIEQQGKQQPFAQTLELTLDGGRYVIARRRSATPKVSTAVTS